MLNMVFADVLGFMVPGALRDLLAGHAGEIDITPGFLLLAAVITEIPIAMVVLSLLLRQRVARWANLVASALTVVYVIGLGSSTPHYIFIAGMETLGCLLIARWAWTWRKSDLRMPAGSPVADRLPQEARA